MSKAPEINALILAGGFGTRLNNHVPGIPKPLVPVGGRPFLARQLKWLASQGVESVVLTVHHMAEQFIAFVESAESDVLPIRIVEEAEPLGTGGAVANAFRQIDAIGTWLVVNGDTEFNFELSKLMQAHQENNSKVTIAIAEVNNASRFGTVQLDGNKIIDFVQANGKNKPGYVNCGAYLIEPEAMKSAPDGKFSIETQFFVDLAKTRGLFAVDVSSDNAFFDIGTPESYDEFCAR
jgi:D-glycero-alpha-D-manno-heptose 1-phosphate guanylyltransferase